MDRLSQLHGLRTFEVVARHQSYVLAARELHVTPAAVGQQIRLLEHWLGVPLFHRLDSGTNRLRITDRAGRAVNDIRSGLESMQRAVKLLQSADRATLTVTASQAFVSKWLMPRLEEFTTDNPDLDVRIDVSDRLLDIVRDEADVGIRCGSGRWPDVSSTHLMPEEVFPVCAPTLLPKRSKRTMQPWPAASVGLIEDVFSVSLGVFPSWKQWSKRAKFGSHQKIGLQVNSSSAAIQAAIAGNGIALARRVLVQDDINRGLLVRLCPDIAHEISWSYFAVRRHDEINLSVDKFCAWLLRAVAEFATSTAPKPSI
jgi:LysR family transcriptional regulator, glycine cleavage system transcriptional activator